MCVYHSDRFPKVSVRIVLLSLSPHKPKRWRVRGGSHIEGSPQTRIRAISDSLVHPARGLPQIPQQQPHYQQTRQQQARKQEFHELRTRCRTREATRDLQPKRLSVHLEFDQASLGKGEELFTLLDTIMLAWRVRVWYYCVTLVVFAAGSLG